jgi:hypothetical protein
MKPGQIGTKQRRRAPEICPSGVSHPRSFHEGALITYAIGRDNARKNFTGPMACRRRVGEREGFAAVDAEKSDRPRCFATQLLRV